MDDARWYEVLFGVAIALAPSLVTALTRYPRTASIAASVARVLDVLSVLTHRDSPGTMKAPGTRSKQP